MGLIFSIAGQKGGIGKTTTTVQLGIALAERNKKTLLIDADPQGGLTAVFSRQTPEGFAADSPESGLYDVFCGNADLGEITRPTLWDALLYVQPGISGEPLPSQVFEDAHQAVGLLREAVVQTAHQFDVILIDCPPGMSTVVTSAINASDYIIVPVQCEPLGLRTFPVFIRYLIHLKQQWQSDTELAGILMTMADGNEKSSETVIRQILDFFDPDSVVPVAIPRDPLLNYIYMDPDRIVTDYRGLRENSPGIQAYQRLAETLIGQYHI